jgi:cytochrome c-type biogenesis protein
VKVKYFFTVLFLFAFSAAAFSQTAPNFELLDTNGNIIKLSDFKGKTVFIDFWATWCPPCRESIPAVKSVHKRFAQNPEVVVLGVNMGEKPGDVINFAKNNAIKYPVLLGDKKTAQNYGITAIPAFFIIDKNGKIMKSYKGYSNSLETEWLLKIRDGLAK